MQTDLPTLRDSAEKAGVPYISIVLPVKNRAGIIGESIQSVLDQTYHDFELIVVDDASTDATPKMVEAFEDPRIKLIRLPESRGASGARNAGIQEVRGAWIAFQDSDDLWLPEKLAQQFQAVKAAGSGCVGVYCSYRRVAPEGMEILPKPGPGLSGAVLPRLLKGNFITTQTFVVRKDAVDAVGEFDSNLGALNDWDFAVRVAQQGDILWVQNPLVVYRVQPDSLSVSLDRFEHDYLYMLEKHHHLMAKKRKDRAWHYAVIGMRMCRDGAQKKGLAYLRKAASCYPVDLRYVACWLLAFMPGGVLSYFSRLYQNIMASGSRRA